MSSSRTDRQARSAIDLANYNAEVEAKREHDLASLIAAVRGELPPPIEHQNPIAPPTPAMNVSRLIAVVSEFGGQGKSTFAYFLARAIAQRATLPVALVEASPLSSHLAARLDLSSPPTLLSLAQAAQYVQGIEDWQPFVEIQPSSRLHIFLAPNHPTPTDLLLGLEYRDLLVRLAKSYSIVVVDTPSGLTHPATLAALEVADQMIVCSAASSHEIDEAAATWRWVKEQGGEMLAEHATLIVACTWLQDPPSLASYSLAPFAVLAQIPFDPSLRAGRLAEELLSLATTHAIQQAVDATEEALSDAELVVARKDDLVAVDETMLKGDQQTWQQT